MVMHPVALGADEDDPLRDLVEPARAQRDDPPDYFGDESFGAQRSYLTPAVFALMPPRLEYGWLRALRAQVPEAERSELKWDHLCKAMKNAPHGEISIGAEKTLSLALLTVLDYEEMRSRERPYSRADAGERWMADLSLTDTLLMTDPLAQLAGAEIEDVRARLGLPGELPDPGDPGFLKRVIEGRLLELDRPEAQPHLMPYSLRATATAVDCLDEQALARKADELLRSGHRYGIEEKLRASTVENVVGTRRSFEQGQTRPTMVVNSLLGAIGPGYDTYYDDMLAGRAPRRPATMVVEHAAVDFEEGQAADMAAGWARHLYNQALKTGSPESGVRALCAHFKGLIFNGKLYQR